MPTSDFEQFAGRSFSFYPPILNVEHNEWTYVEGAWSEVRVRNTGTEFDLWIPRRYIGEVSQVEDPVMIIGLNQELAYKGGMVVPHRRRVVEMPRSTNVPPPSSQAGKEPTPPPAAPKSFSSDSAAEKSIGKLVLGVLGQEQQQLVAVSIGNAAIVVGGAIVEADGDHGFATRHIEQAA